MTTGKHPPMVVWRRAGCGCRVLRVFLTPSGWTVALEDFEVRPGPGLHAAGFTSGDPRLRRFTPQRRNMLLPHDLDSWPTPLGESFIGCEHGSGPLDFSQVVLDLRLVRATRKPLGARRVTLAEHPNRR